MQNSADWDTALQSVAVAGQLKASSDAGKIEKDNLDFMIDAFNQTYEHQVAKFDYDKSLQQKIFDREDTAVQRRVADLKSAGLSPIFAMGKGAGAGSVVPKQAPAKQAPQRGLQSKLMAQAAMRDMANIAKSRAETKLLFEQSEALRATTNKTKEETKGITQTIKHRDAMHPWELDKAITDASIAKNQNVQEWARGVLAKYDVEEREAYLQWVKQRAKDLDIPYIPYEGQVYLAAVLANEEGFHNLDWFKKHKQPTKGRIYMENLAKDEYEKTTGRLERTWDNFVDFMQNVLRFSRQESTGIR